MGKIDSSKNETKAFAAALAKVDLFADLTAKQVSMIADLCRRERFAAGQVIVNQGTDSSRFYLVTEGEVTVKVNDRPIAGIASNASRLPDSTTLFSSWVVSPSSLASRGSTPGSASPNWPRSSSMLTTPFEAIWLRASSARDT